MELNSLYKDETHISLHERPDVVSAYNHDFNYFESDKEFFSQCFLDLQNLLDFQNIINSIDHYKQVLTYLTIYIKRNPSIFDTFNDSNFYSIIENYILSQETSIIDAELLSQLISICSICLSLNPQYSFPINLIAIILSYIQIDQNYEILRSSLFFLYFLQDYRSDIKDTNYLYNLNSLIDQQDLISNILEIEKVIWLHIFHFSNYQNFSEEEATDLLYAVYTTLSSFFLLKNICINDYSILPDFSPNLYQEIYFRIYEALKFIVHNINESPDNSNEIDCMSVVQSILFLLFNSIAYDNEFESNTSSLSIDQMLLEMIRIDPLSVNNELILEIISRIISNNEEFFNMHDLFESFIFLLENNLTLKEEEDFVENDENSQEIQDEKVIILIFQILSKIYKNQFNFQSRVICIQFENTLDIYQNDRFYIPSNFISSAIKMLKDTTYSIKVAVNHFISTLIIFGGNSIISEIINSIDEHNQIIQLFHDFLIYNDQSESDQNKDDWIIKQMKLSIKLLLNFFSTNEEEDFSSFGDLLDDLYQYVYDDEDENDDIENDELFGIGNDYNLIDSDVQV